MTRESSTQDAIRLAATDLGLVLWRNNVGRTVIGNRTIVYGLAPGSSDLIGMLKPEGTFAAIEVKSSSGKATDKQSLFIDLVRRNGGFGCVARSVDDVRDALAEWRAR